MDYRLSCLSQPHRFISKTISKNHPRIFLSIRQMISFWYKKECWNDIIPMAIFSNYGSIYINENTDVISVNGFKTILFSPDFGKIIQLDNRLRELDIIDAYNLGTYIITCVGSSYDNNYLWLFDAGSQRLIKLDKDQTPSFSQ